MAQTKMTIRMDTDVKQQAQELFAKFGLDMTTAINMFLNQAVMEQSIPFRIYIPKSQEKLVVNFETKSEDENIIDNASDLIISQNIDVFKELAK